MHPPRLRAGRQQPSGARPPGNTGDGIRIAQAAGAAFVDDPLHAAAWTPVSLVPQPDGRTIPFPHFIDRGKPGYIAVDRRGRRFANEATSYHDFQPRWPRPAATTQKVEVWLVCDHAAIRRFGLGAVGPAPARLAPLPLRLHPDRRHRSRARAAGRDRPGRACRGDRATTGMLRRARTRISARAAGRRQRFNGAAGHEPNPCVAPLATPPFYAVRLVPSALGTFAGLKTDARARVLDTSGAPIKGLYAVGNDQASVMAGTYPGAGITLGPAMTFGWIAARHIAAAVSRP